jgi:hypothetical protein
MNQVVAGRVVWAVGRVSDKTLFGMAASPELTAKEKCVRCFFRFADFKAGLEFIDPNSDEPCYHQTISFVPVKAEAGNRYLATEIVLHNPCADHGHQQYLAEIAEIKEH